MANTMRRSSPITARLLLVVCAALVASAFSTQGPAAPPSQPADERAAQNKLPQAHDPMWESFFKCKVHYDDKTHHYSIDYTPEVQALDGKPTTVSGFMMPLEPTETFNHFLLAKRTPTCPFCPPGEPNEILEVFTKKPVKWEEGVVVVTGTMKLISSNPELGLFFQLNDSTSMDAKPYAPKDKVPVV